MARHVDHQCPVTAIFCYHREGLYLNLWPAELKNERKLARISSLSTLILGLLLLLAAWRPPEMIIW
ncbi:hypothetical protein [Yersinia pseudotuberculosis]|uniref:hypothetical protein n=1 Tax=Yersinia pseudotuberculosis TaxID=633 RepID=UPI0038CD7FFE